MCVYALTSELNKGALSVSWQSSYSSRLCGFWWEMSLTQGSFLILLLAFLMATSTYHSCVRSRAVSGLLFKLDLILVSTL